jgi:hypothetical protein
MKQILAFFRRLAEARREANAYHDDLLRANQFNEPRRLLSPWLILIS